MRIIFGKRDPKGRQVIARPMTAGKDSIIDPIGPGTGTNWRDQLLAASLRLEDLNAINCNPERATSGESLMIPGHQKPG